MDRLPLQHIFNSSVSAAFQMLLQLNSLEKILTLTQKQTRKRKRESACCAKKVDSEWEMCFGGKILMDGLFASF